MDKESFIMGVAVGAVATFGILLGVGYWLYANQTKKTSITTVATVASQQQTTKTTTSNQQQSTTSTSVTTTSIPNIITTAGFHCEPIGPVSTIIGAPIQCKVTETQQVEVCKVTEVKPNGTVVVECEPVTQPPRSPIIPMTSSVG